MYDYLGTTFRSFLNEAQFFESDRHGRWDLTNEGEGETDIVSRALGLAAGLFGIPKFGFIKKSADRICITLT